MTPCGTKAQRILIRRYGGGHDINTNHCQFHGITNRKKALEFLDNDIIPSILILNKIENLFILFLENIKVLHLKSLWFLHLYLSLEQNYFKYICTLLINTFQLVVQ